MAFLDALPDLPVAEAVPELKAALHERGSAVLVAPPGAGKTTLVPLVLLNEPWLDGRKILILEPRRLAARAAAARMAYLVGEDGVGGTVGYRVRMDTRVSSETRIEVVTEGVLTRMLQSDPSLGETGLVVFDEFHERSLHADLGLALTLHSRRLFRNELRLLVMSATLDAAPVAELLEDAPVVESRGREFPVETRFRKRPVEGWIEPPVVRTVLRALERDEGDVLVFLPGAGEIRRTAQRLEEEGVPDATAVLPLFGSLRRKEQDRAIAPSQPGRRKVVLATAIAETSLTIEGVEVVVDSGLMRVPRFDPGSGMTRLETRRVTRDAADQRRGRAGRLGPGICYRLWTEGEDRGLVPHRRPEILEADLAPLALELAAWGAGPDELSWLDPPPEAAYAQAVELLRELEALDEEGAITDHGKEMARLGHHPRLAHMLVRAREKGLEALACDLAALLGDRDILDAEGRAPDADLRLRVEALGRARQGGHARVSTVKGQRVHAGGLRRALRESGHWRRRLGVHPEARVEAEQVERVGTLCALAYPDRIGRRRPDERGRFLLRNGRGAGFHEAQPLEVQDWIVAVEVQGRGREDRIFRAAPVTLEEIQVSFAEQIREVQEVTFDPEAERVRAERKRVLGALVLSIARLGDPPEEELRRALLDGIRSQGLQVLPWTKVTRQLRERLEFLHRMSPQEWPDRSEEALESSLDDWLGPFTAGMRSFDDLKRLNLEEALLSGLGWKQRARLDGWAPTHLEVPSGSRLPVDYSDPRAPALAVRIQEVFGLAETPRIAGGRVHLTMKLLSPAHRPVQITRDLASFWSDAYFEVRKDLKGRYPKHYWPDDPLEATATRRTKPSGE